MNDHSGPVSVTEPPAPAQGRPDPTTAPQDPARTNAYLNAISTLGEFHWVKLSTRRIVVDECMKVADAEQADLKAEVESLRSGIALATSEMDRAEVDRDLLKSVQTALETEVDRLRTDATWDRLAAETGAERAQAEAARLVDRINRQALTITRHQTLYDEAKARALALDADLTDRDGTIERLWRQLNEATNRPDHECSLGWGTDCDGTYCNPGPPDPSGGRGFPEGYGTWLADRDLIAHDPPKRAPEDPLAASKAAILKAMREMEPT